MANSYPAIQEEKQSNAHFVFEYAANHIHVSSFCKASEMMCQNPSACKIWPDLDEFWGAKRGPPTTQYRASHLYAVGLQVLSQMFAHFFWCMTAGITFCDMMVGI